MGHRHVSARTAVGSSKLIAMGLLESVVAMAYLVAKHTSRASKKLVRRVSSKGSSKRLTRGGRGEEEFDFGLGDDGGVWQRSIMMGDRCQPLDFSGVIYYDCDGRRVTDPPAKSPRGGPGLVAQHGGV